MKYLPIFILVLFTATIATAQTSLNGQLIVSKIDSLTCKLTKQVDSLSIALDKKVNSTKIDALVIAVNQTCLAFSNELHFLNQHNGMITDSRSVEEYNEYVLWHNIIQETYRIKIAKINRLLKDNPT